MKNVKLVLRFLLGIGLVIFGINKFMHFMVPPASPELTAFSGAIAETGYLFQFIGVLYILCGLLLLLNKYVSLALLVLLPIFVVAFTAHLFLDIAGIAGSTIFLTIIIVLMFENKSRYSEVLKA